MNNGIGYEVTVLGNCEGKHVESDMNWLGTEVLIEEGVCYREQQLCA